MILEVSSIIYVCQLYFVTLNNTPFIGWELKYTLSATTFDLYTLLNFLFNENCDYGDWEMKTRSTCEEVIIDVNNIGCLKTHICVCVLLAYLQVNFVVEEASNFS